MTAISEVAIICFALVLAVPVSVLFLQILMAFKRHTESRIPEGRRPRLTVLVPAHNEQSVITPTLASISRQLKAGDRLVVIADNCSDHTVKIALQQGVEVTIRNDQHLRGKGFALDHGIRFLEQTGSPDVVIIIDADCQLAEGCIDRIGRQCGRLMRPMQAAYLIAPPRSLQKNASLVSFAWKLKNFVRPLGFYRLQLPCQLVGSGMAFPWEVIQSATLASGHLVEDLKLGLDLALTGKFPLFCPDAVITSDVAPEGIPSYSQRARWEHGTIETMVHYLPRLFFNLSKRPSLALIAVALDLSVPPLALLALALGAQLALSLLFLHISGRSVPVVISSIALALFFISVFMAWWRHGREILPFHWLAFAPIYAIVKVPLYAKFFINRQREWAKGKRKMRG